MNKHLRWLKFYDLKIVDFEPKYAITEDFYTVDYKGRKYSLKIICRVYKGIDHLFVQKVATIFNTFSMELQRSVIMSLSFFEQAIFFKSGDISRPMKEFIDSIIMLILGS